jgi:hypothetical protein
MTTLHPPMPNGTNIGGQAASGGKPAPILRRWIMEILLAIAEHNCLTQSE